MSRKNFLKKLILATMSVGSLIFVPPILNLDAGNLVASVAHAEFQNYTAQDTAMFDFGENDEYIVNTVKKTAQRRAIKAAREKAGVYLSSYSQVLNGKLTKNDISVVTNSISEVVETTYEKFTFQAQDTQGTLYGKTGIIYRATVTVKLDPNEINEYINRDANEKAKLIKQDKNTQAEFSELNARFEDLKMTAAKKTPKQVKAELKKINEEILAEEKVEEGNKFAYQRDYQGAMSKYNEAMQLSPKNTHVRKNIETICSYWQNTEKAMADYNGAIAKNPQNSEAYRNRAMFHFYLNKYENAIKDLDKAIELNPNKARYYFDRGYIYYKIKKNNTEALKDLTKAIELAPNEPVFYIYRAYIYEALGQQGKARADNAKVNELNSKKF